MGKGQKSCFRYLKERAGGMDQAYREYVMGYLTAYNAVAPETYSISRDMNLDQIMTWLDDYCDANQVTGLEQSCSSSSTTTMNSVTGCRPAGWAVEESGFPLLLAGILGTQYLIQQSLWLVLGNL